MLFQPSYVSVQYYTYICTWSSHMVCMHELLDYSLKMICHILHHFSELGHGRVAGSEQIKNGNCFSEYGAVL